MIISFLAFGFFAAQAQRLTDGKGAYLGFKAGVNFSNIIKSGDTDFKSKFKPGLAAGIFVDIPVTEAFSFAPN